MLGQKGPAQLAADRSGPKDQPVLGPQSRDCQRGWKCLWTLGGPGLAGGQCSGNCSPSGHVTLRMALEHSLCTRAEEHRHGGAAPSSWPVLYSLHGEGLGWLFPGREPVWGSGAGQESLGQMGGRDSPVWKRLSSHAPGSGHSTVSWKLDPRGKRAYTLQPKSTRAGCAR